VAIRRASLLDVNKSGDVFGMFYKVPLSLCSDQKLGISDSFQTEARGGETWLKPNALSDQPLLARPITSLCYGDVPCHRTPAYP